MSVECGVKRRFGIESMASKSVGNSGKERKAALHAALQIKANQKFPIAVSA